MRTTGFNMLTECRQTDTPPPNYIPEGKTFEETPSQTEARTRVNSNVTTWMLDHGDVNYTQKQNTHFLPASV